MSYKCPLCGSEQPLPPDEITIRTVNNTIIERSYDCGCKDRKTK